MYALKSTNSSSILSCDSFFTNKKRKVSLHAMKAYEVSGGVFPLILNLGTRQR
jgi:hypothetical protein